MTLPPVRHPGGNSHARFTVVGFCFLLAVITYMDRACIGVLSGTIREDLGLSMQQMGFVFSAFTISYAIFEIPSAWWGGKVGTRRVLTRIITWWSVFTMLTAAATGYVSLMAIRFLFGAGEAGAWPNATRVFSRWIPLRERGRVQGIFFAGAHMAAGLTPPLIILVLQPLLGWRGVFALFGVFGLFWGVAWYRWFRDRPEDHKSVSAAELAYIRQDGVADDAAHGISGNVAWRAILTSPHIWLLSLVAFASSYGFYFVITWLPTFLDSLGLSLATSAAYAGLPMIFSIPADILGGATTDWLAGKFGLRLGRAIAGGAAFAVAGVSMFAATQMSSPHLIALLLAVGGGASMFALAASWASCIEIAGAHSGVASAIMNTIGQGGAMLSPIVTAWLVGMSGNSGGGWILPLQIIAGLYLLACLSWIFINPNARIAQ